MKIGHKNERISLLVVGLLLLCASAGTAQSAADDPALQKEIDALKAGQQAIQKDLAEIKKLLQNQRRQPAKAAPFKPQDVSIKGAPFLGDANAKLTLVEFTDYQCPFCKRHFNAVLPQIKKAYVETGKVKYVMRQFPLFSIHPRATKASEAALCAGDQGKYWEVHDRIFVDQRKLSDEDLQAHAEAESLDGTQFKDCLSSGNYTAQVKLDAAEGAKAGVRGTPSFFLGLTDPSNSDKIRATQYIRGAQAFPSFKSAIDKMLSADKGSD